VIEASGIRFLVERTRLSLVAGLELRVEQSFGRKVLFASHPFFAPGGGC
jgi:hypothetical protein